MIEIARTVEEAGIVTSTGSGIKPLLGKLDFNEKTGMLEIKGRDAKFNPGTGILEITDRSEQVYAKLQGLFNSIRLITPEVNGSNLQPPPMRVSRINEQVAA